MHEKAPPPAAVGLQNLVIKKPDSHFTPDRLTAWLLLVAAVCLCTSVNPVQLPLNKQKYDTLGKKGKQRHNHGDFPYHLQPVSEPKHTLCWCD